MDLNEIKIIGRLTADPKACGKDRDVAMMNVAVNNVYKGEKTAMFFTVFAYGQSAKFCLEYPSKGDTVYASGRLTVDTYEKTNGEVGISLSISANNVLWLPVKNSEREEAPQWTKKKQGADDIPF